ncbi:MAG TPA: nitroreductase family protein [Solirubrobacteraceae bacterium]|nr:nitroreductase family protein [Solirubrobacteraceae bacterium]
MDLNEVMLCAPTTRRFLPDPVDPGALRRVLDNARFAPSGGNRQGWRVIAVTDAGTRETLADLYLPHWRAYMDQTGAAEMLARPQQHDEARVRMLRRADEFAERLGEVPLHLVICVRLGDLAIVDRGLDRPSIVGGASVYPFVQNVLLGLRNEGLGASLTTLLAPAEPQVRRLLAIPDDVVLAAYVLAGSRADPWPKRLSRKAVAEFAFSERYGEPLA